MAEGLAYILKIGFAFMDNHFSCLPQKVIRPQGGTTR